MKSISLAVLAAVIVILPAMGLADQGSYATPSPQMRQAFQYMEQARVKVDQLHAQARMAMLSALSPAHRTLLAQVVGQLAISPSPNVNQAARTLDASLSQGEGRTILSISQSLENQSRQIMEAAHQQMMAAMPPPGPPGPSEPVMAGPGQAPGRAGLRHNVFFVSHEDQGKDPGAILLSMSAHVLEPFGPDHALMMYRKL
jgi:hypothetical protein